MDLLYDAVIQVVGNPSNMFQENACYVTACVIVVFTLWMIVSLGKWVTKW
jgi:hypothetical protein